MAGTIQLSSLAGMDVVQLWRVPGVGYGAVRPLKLLEGGFDNLTLSRI
jgi:hypothetical protein